MPADDRAIPTFEDDLERFLIAWYGPPARPDARRGQSLPRPLPLPRGTSSALPTRIASSALPAALKAWHRQVARWDEPATRLNRVLDERDAWYDDEILVICTEGQGCWLWGVIPNASDPDDDPPVVERDQNTRDGWTVTGERLSDFLLHVALIEAILGAPCRVGLDDATGDQLRTLTTEMAVVRVPPWRWPGPRHTLWQRGRALALTCVNRLPDSWADPTDPDCTWWVVIGAREPEDLDFIRGHAIIFDENIDLTGSGEAIPENVTLCDSTDTYRRFSQSVDVSVNMHLNGWPTVTDVPDATASAGSAGPWAPGRTPNRHLP